MTLECTYKLPLFFIIYLQIQRTGSTSTSATATTKKKKPDSIQPYGGDLVTKFENYKYMVGILYIKNGIKDICTGSIITNSKVLTAATCVLDVRSVKLLFGSANLDRPFHTEIIDIIHQQKIIIHPEYDENTGIKNIAMIQLDEMLEYGSHIGKVVLKPYIANSGDSVRLLSYSDNLLRSVNAKVVDFVACRLSYWQRDSDSSWFDDKTQFCVKLNAGKYNGNERFIGGILLLLK